MPTSSSTPAPSQSRPWKNSTSGLSKKPFARESSGEHTLRDIERTISCSSHVEIHPGQR